jgi:replication factor C subunit 2/4
MGRKIVRISRHELRLDDMVSQMANGPSRPKNMQQVASQEEVVEVLRKTIESANVSSSENRNLTMVASPLALLRTSRNGKDQYNSRIGSRTLWVPSFKRGLIGRHENFKSRVLELNASDERGIEVVREKVKNFARVQVTTSSSDKCPPYKIIILDEADSMTVDAQSALRRTMETYSKITRFCLICNYVSRIIEPLASRCAKFRFRPLDTASMQAKLREVAHAEEVKISQDGIDALIDASEGDLRRGLQLLQSAHRLHMKQTIERMHVLEISGVR